MLRLEKVLREDLAKGTVTPMNELIINIEKRPGGVIIGVKEKIMRERVGKGRARKNIGNMCRGKKETDGVHQERDEDYGG